MPSLFHVSGWSHLSSVAVGDTFTLRPGTQCAEGIGVYFAEEEQRFSAAEGAANGASAIVKLSTDNAVGWWRTKANLARKFKRARTWHTDGKSVVCKVINIENTATRTLVCEWSFS